MYCLGRIQLAFALLHFVPQGQTWPVTPGISRLPIFALQSPVINRTFFMCVLRGLLGVHRTDQTQVLNPDLLIAGRFRIEKEKKTNKQKTPYSKLILQDSHKIRGRIDYQNSTRQTTVTRVNRIQKQHVIPQGPIEVAIIRLKMYNMQFKKIQNLLKHKELSRNYQNKQTENVFTS